MRDRMLDLTPWRRAGIAALAVLASATSLRNGFAYDDVALVEANPAAHHLSEALHAFVTSYWPATLGGSLYRPLTSALFAIEWVVGGGAPSLFHVVSVALYVGVALAVLALADRLLPPVAAWVAAALFAVHPVHVEVVANVVGQGELLAALAVTVAMVRYLDHRRPDGPPLDGRAIAMLAALYGVGLLAKEHAVVLPALCVAAEVTVVRDDRSWRARVAALRATAAALVLTGVAWLAIRMCVLGSAAGESTLLPLVRSTWSTRWWTTIGVVPQWVRLLGWPARLVATYSPPEVAIRTGADAWVALGLAIVALALAIVVLGRRRWPVIVFGLAWTGLVLLPVSNLLVPTGVLLAERSLFLPSVGAMLALASAGWGALEWASSAHLPGDTAAQWRRWLAAPLLVLVLVLGVVRSATRGPVWRDDATLFASGVHDGPDDYFTHFLEARALARTGRSADAERELRTAIRLAPDDPRLYAFLGWHALQAGDCDAATPAFRQALALWPMSYEARAGLVTCLLHAGEYAEVRSLSIVAVASGGHQAFFRRALVAADSARRADSLHHHGDGA